MKGFAEFLSVALLVAHVTSQDQNCVDEALSCDDPVPTIYKLGDQSCACNSPAQAGAFKYLGGKVQVCLGSEWKTIEFEEADYGTEKNPGLSCKDIKDKASGRQLNNGVFWIRLQGKYNVLLHSQLWTLFRVKFFHPFGLKIEGQFIIKRCYTKML